VKKQSVRENEKSHLKRGKNFESKETLKGLLQKLQGYLDKHFRLATIDIENAFLHLGSNA
jgi:hypothetical protein